MVKGGLAEKVVGMVGSILLLGMTFPNALWGAEILESAEIVRRFLDAAKASAERESMQELVYLRRSVFEHLKGDGSVEKSRSKEHCVTNSLGVIRAQLIRVNDRQPTIDEIDSDRQDESEGRRRFSRRNRGPDFLDARLANQFEFTWEALESVAGREVYRLAFEPAREGHKSTKDSTISNNRDVDRVIGLLHGHLWIDTQTFELVRMECSLRSSLRILGGLAGSVSRFELAVDRRPVAPDCWSSVCFRTHIEARKLVSPLRIRASVEQDGFKVRPIDPAPAKQ